MDFRFTVATAALLAATAAGAREYTLITYETRAQLAQRDSTTYWGGFNAVAGGLARSGALKGGSALAPQPGPGPQVSGYFVIDVSDEAAAQAWAARLPVGPGGRVSVHAHVPNPTM